MSNLKSLGIPGLPSSIDILLKGSIYAAIVDSIPAHLSIIIQALKANIAAGNTCVLLTHFTKQALFFFPGRGLRNQHLPSRHKAFFEGIRILPGSK
jgi:hypothetical protein